MNHCSIAVLALLSSACARVRPVPAVGAAAEEARDESSLSCPRCKGRSIVPIAYGLLNAEGLQKVRDGLIVSGGCLVGRENPDWHCKACDHEWHDAEDPKRKAAWDAVDRENQAIYDRLEALQKSANEPQQRTAPGRRR